MFYKQIIRPLLFLINPEKAHHFTTGLLHIILKIPFAKGILKSMFTIKDESLKKQLFGLTFENPVGLAAGFDKQGDLFEDFSNLGFGFIEVGTVTPKGQPGNPKPRMFRLPKDKALINRMGFNNDGLETLISKLKKRKTKIVIGGNIGKNKITPNENAVYDYLICYNKLFDYVDYFVVNVSSPNTPNLRELQEKEPLKKLLNALVEKNNLKPNKKPILLKIAPDVTNTQLDDIIKIALEIKLDGLIATNTTTDRSKLTTNNSAVESIGAGGVSGLPVAIRSNEVIRYLRQNLGTDFPIIGVGGIFTAQDAIDKLEAGADLVQVYTGFIYEGPAMVKKINQGLVTYNK